MRQALPLEQIGHAVAARRERPRPGEERRDRRFGEIIVLRAEHDPDRRARPRQPMRVERCELRLDRARLGERQDIAGRERTAGNPAEPGAGVGRGRAEHVWHIDAAGDRALRKGVG